MGNNVGDGIHCEGSCTIDNVWFPYVCDDAITILGGGTVTMAGAFFTPYANDMAISGGGIWDVRGAQFISRRLSASGGANLTMAPNPVVALVLPPREGFLIR